MAEGTALSMEESLPYYAKARERALENNSYLVLRHRIDLPEEVKKATLKAWIESGWLTETKTLTDAPGYRLPEAYRAYLPGEKRTMSESERDELLVLVRTCTKANGSVSVSGLSRQDLWRLIEDGVIIRTIRQSASKYSLAETYR